MARTLTLADLPAEERRHIGTSCHEAAHAVVGAIHDMTVESAEVLRGGPVSGHTVAGRTRFEPRSHAAAKEFQPLMLAAGSVAETLWHRGSPTLTQVWRALTDVHSHDLNSLSALSLAQGQNPIAAVQTVLPMIDGKLWPAVAKLARQIYDKGPIGHRDVLSALSVPSAEDAPRYMRAIRAGAEPGQLHVGSRHFF